ncbi:hypothetical protein HHK36_020507 [Tetracentron sinense]|uniref:Uncharacterized protein n=1 Tax=Tetracentron sinense TaxID=13715 RepID=A0A834YV89_TETSI|nr:hypothetical protein HHK36_020507 [Tetracentron sinense]
MTMLSLTPLKPFSLFNHNHLQTSSFLNLHRINLLNRHSTTPKRLPRPIISAAASPSTPSSTPSNQVYQPFRPPPSPLPSRFGSLDSNGRIEILSNRLGLWFEYAPLIPSLFQEGFSPSSIEELTGISGVEQNRLVVAAKVRDSLVQSKLDPETLNFFDNGGAELLYEIRLLSSAQRESTARYIAENRLDARGAQELARAMKDFPRRRGDDGWESFTYPIPGDCLSYMYFRQSKEHQNQSELRISALQRALEVAETEKAKQMIQDALAPKLDDGKGGEGEIGIAVKVPLVRMKIGEVGEATSVVVLPVCKAEEGVKGVEEAPGECKTEGEFGVVVAEKAWRRWVVFPGWDPVMGLGPGGVVVAFADARVLPWKVNRWYKEEAILVVADRSKKDVVVDDGFYLVSSKENGGDLKVERGSVLKKLGVKDGLGTVVLVVRPPREDTEEMEKTLSLCLATATEMEKTLSLCLATATEMVKAPWNWPPILPINSDGLLTKESTEKQQQQQQQQQQQLSRLQRRAPASLQVSPPSSFSSDWKIVIPLLSPLATSPKLEVVKPQEKLQQEHQCLGTEKPVFKKWQHPAAPFCHEPAPFVPSFAPQCR